MTYLESSPHRKEKNTSKSNLSVRVLSTPIGLIKLTAEDGHIISCQRHKGALTLRAVRNIPTLDARALDRAERQIQEFFHGKRRSFQLPLKLVGPEFHQAVWKEMLKIPFGETVSYKELAKKAGRPRAARAVGQACNKNPLLLLNPCHRVLASNGGLGGFALGLTVKRQLLRHEGATYATHQQK